MILGSLGIIAINANSDWGTDLICESLTKELASSSLPHNFDTFARQTASSSHAL